MAGSYRVKMSSAMKPFVSRVSRNGKIQRAFANAGWVKTLSQCVKDGVKEDMSGGAIKNKVRECAKAAGAKGSTIDGFPGSGGRWKLPKSQRGY